MFVNKHSDFLALGFLTGIDVICTLGLLSVTPSGVDIIAASIISTPEVVTDNSTNVHMAPKPVKKPSAKKSLCLFTNILEVKPTTAKRRFVAAKSRRKSMKVCNSLWKEKKRKGHSIIHVYRLCLI